MIIQGMSKGFFIFILAITTLGFLHILGPYFSAILWAAILAIIFHPLKSKIGKHCGDRNGLASMLTLLIICLIVFIPLAVVASSLAVEFNALYNRIQANQTELTTVASSVVNHLPEWLRHFLAENNLTDANAIQQKLSGVAMKGGQFFAGSLMMIGKSTFSFTIGFGIMLYLLFFLLKDGAYLVGMALDAIPLSRFVKHHLFVKFAAVSRATVKGTVVVAVVQGTLGGIAFWCAGIQGSILWGSLMAFLSLIPAVGSAIIWLPVVIWLLFSGAMVKGLALTFFFVVVIGLVDNILRPLLVGKDTKMPDYLILISTLGGMEIYGINGFVIGPLIAALFISCWNLLSGRDHRGNTDEIDSDFMEEGQNHPGNEHQ
ncbi:AI-2E family transporter [Erwinia pyrifoliae]|uniref:AI-2E family transporter n=1 Tax=Erwinia pyrifoliae TaxID=79967 RepID=A0ABY5XCI6_ERWPY|nr:AI-2E family transporter [Erwinia pyrifoliae]AUX72918.1 AI-2E family transporter [Erwinia pyrifoliae]MCA8876810.1 AI-2E family transporter [Erwinia pyrifoliae]MCT2386968.1 AI-2E family transporter [Erwinia pyrifoliae]MCU8587433.1 AI-2E family transporter [Erwinia pyrifoliae]UWS31280.1 AI-2E family transporter [Erwinia pyrifoliae]